MTGTKGYISNKDLLPSVLKLGSSGAEVSKFPDSSLTQRASPVMVESKCLTPHHITFILVIDC